MVGRHELGNEAWTHIKPLLPEPGRRNGRWRDHPHVVKGICWKLATGAPWRDIPEGLQVSSSTGRSSRCANGWPAARSR